MRFVIFFVFIFIFCVSADQRYTFKSSITEEIKEKYYSDFSSFNHSVNVLVHQAKANSSFKSLTQQIKQCRLDYKKVEFIFEYFETEFAYLYINGGPLPKLHKESSEIDIIDPNGLQTLDELTVAKDTVAAKHEILLTAIALQKSLKLISPSNNQIRLDERKIIEAMRSGIVRVFTLGLTGFDTPGSGNSIEEARISLLSISEVVRLFNISKQTRIGNALITKLLKSVEALDNSSFGSLDRLNFLTEYVESIYKGLLELQIAHGLPTDQFKNHAQDYTSKSLFDEDFINTEHYSQFTYLSFKNKKSIALGRILFNDPILSKNLDLSCASCHDSGKAFTDNLPKSKTNLAGKFTQRNSPTLIDAGYSSRFFWDMREFDLERQVAHVISDSLEFNLSFEDIVDRLNQSDKYRNLFREVYNGISVKDINSRSIANAVAAYVNSLKSFDSPFDKYVRSERTSLPAEVKNGFNLFMGKANCGTCHFAPVFNGSVPPFYTDAESEVLGVTTGMASNSPVVLDDDLGRSNSGLSGDAHPHFNHSFKTVTVRNSELTFPYMHNGAFNSLEEVMTFYNNGGGVGMGLKVDNQTLSADSLGLSDNEVGSIIAFLHSLTDTSGLTEPIIELPRFEGQPYWNQRNTKLVYD